MSTIKIMSGGAAQGLVKKLEPALFAATGSTVDGAFSAVGGMKARLTAGENTDVIILTAAIISELEAQGIATGGESRVVGNVTTAVAMRVGDAPKTVANADDLKAALLAASSIYFPDPALATAGIHFANVLRQLGIYDETHARHRVFQNGATAMAALSVSTEPNPIGCTQLTEIISTSGIRGIGDLPGHLGLSTTYTAALAAASQQPKAARWLIAALVSPENAGIRSACGFS